MFPLWRHTIAAGNRLNDHWRLRTRRTEPVSRKQWQVGAGEPGVPRGVFLSLRCTNGVPQVVRHDLTHGDRDARPRPQRVAAAGKVVIIEAIPDIVLIKPVDPTGKIKRK